MADEVEEITAESVLTCDVCRQRIGADSRGSAMLYWSTGEDRSSPAAVSELALAHKRCVREGSDLDRRLDLSAEIDWFAEPMGALVQLARLATGYAWGTVELRRLALIVWAAGNDGVIRRRRERTLGVHDTGLSGCCSVGTRIPADPVGSGFRHRSVRLAQSRASNYAVLSTSRHIPTYWGRLRQPDRHGTISVPRSLRPIIGRRL